MSDTTTPDDPATFATQLAHLEQAVKDLETGRLDLDAALKKFEEGVALTRDLRARLDDAEGRIEQLLEDGGVAPLDVD